MIENTKTETYLTVDLTDSTSIHNYYMKLISLESKGTVSVSHLESKQNLLSVYGKDTLSKIWITFKIDTL